MNKQEKWELICRYLSIKKEGSNRKIKFTNSKERFSKSVTFDDLLNSMEEKLNGLDSNVSMFETQQKEVKTELLDLPESINEIILFDEYKDFPFLKEIEPWKVPFLFVRGTEENFKEILNQDIEDAISIVGSRETPDIYSKWIQERIPKNKVVVSGLANGADLIGHRVAMDKEMKIVVFPGYDISKNPSKQKMDVWNYALGNGLILSSVVPGVKTFVQADLINRNYEMAKVVSATYALFFGLKSGTLNHLKAVAEDDKKIFVPLNIYKDVIPQLQNEFIRNSAEAK